jgi:urease accessory protein
MGTIAPLRSPLIRAGSSTTSAFQRVQNGIGHLVATAAPDTSKSSTGGTEYSTYLTRVSHQAPARLIPLQSSAVQAAGATIAYLGNYGGGILPGDTLHYRADVLSHATLALLTQGSNRVYPQSSLPQTVDGIATSPGPQTTKPSRSVLDLRVDEHALCVVTLDPVTPFRGSVLEQMQTAVIDPNASLALVDWISSGRYVRGERWEQTSLLNQTEIYFNDHDSSHPVLVDRVILDGNTGMDFRNASLQFNAYASLVLYGSRVEAVVERCHDMAASLARPYTRIRERTPNTRTQTRNSDHDNLPFDGSCLAGRVLCSVTTVPTRHADVYVARLAACSNEDLYRVFHHLLQPTAEDLGYPIYRDRIRAVTSSPVRNISAVPESTSRLEENAASVAIVPTADDHLVPPPSSDATYWNAFVLADSALPTGSFAHSAGLEAAAQLGLVAAGNNNNSMVSDLVRATATSTMQTVTPALLASHKEASSSAFGADGELDAEFITRWNHLDRNLHSLLVGNGPACRASLDQGRNLLRVVQVWFQQGTKTHTKVTTNQVLSILQARVRDDPSAGHLPTIFGVVAALLDLTAPQACQLLAYCVARDVVSAAVRLNMVGPMASVGILSDAQQAGQRGIALGRTLYENGLSGGKGSGASCAPVLDVLQPCHDLLSTRLFRT